MNPTGFSGGASPALCLEDLILSILCNDAYTSLRGCAVNMRKPYPTHACVDSLTKFLAKFNPKVASVTVKDVVDSSLVAELDKSGFIDSVYKEISRGK